MKAVVFGGSGFLGSHVADELHSQGYEITIFDINPSPYLKKEFNMVVGNTSDKHLVSQTISGMDYVFQYSGIAGMKDADEEPIATAEANITSTLYILDACVRHNVKRFMYASTVYVYSAHGSFYRCSKQAAELFIKNYLAVYGLRYTILRYGSLYGKRANHFNFIRNIIRQAFLEKKMTREGNGDEIRDYIHVIDAARATVELLKSNKSADYVMLTGNRPIRVKDLLYMIKEILSDEVDIEFSDGVLEGHYQITPYSFKPDIARKYVLDHYHDLGQGILDCIYDVYEELLSDGEKMRLNFNGE